MTLNCCTAVPAQHSPVAEGDLLVDLRLAHDVRVADWVVRRIFQPAHHPRSVTHYVPEVFDAYARIFHPVHAVGPGGAWMQLQWSDIAERVGLPLTPTTGWLELANADDLASLARGVEYSRLPPDWHPNAAYRDEDIRQAAPVDGELDEGRCRVLARMLANFTTTPHACWFAMWHGYGAPFDGLPSFDDVPTAAAPPEEDIPLREYALLEGPVDEVDQFRMMDGLAYQCPTIWWPDDRAWLVHTEIDWTSTFVGGDIECIHALVDADDLEVMEIRVGDVVGM